MTMALSATFALTTTNTAHPYLGCKTRILNIVPWRISPEKGYTLSIRSRAARISSDNGVKTVKPAKQVVTKSSFPPDFVFGAGTSSYQIEGGWDEDGKGPSIWDHYCHTYPEKIVGGGNGDIAVNSYHMYEEDVKMLKAMGMDAYKFSISWPRILPKGTLQGGINQAGIDYYNNLINKLLENGIKPYVVLFHWETPLALEKDYQSFLSPRIVNDFKDYVEVCFKNFGDRVKHWFTFNEPYVFVNNAYGAGKHAPGRCSPDANPDEPCVDQTGNSLVEPYKVGHNLLLAHAEAVCLYKQKYQEHQQGEIGIALVSMDYEPLSNTEHVHSEAQHRFIDYNLGWFLEPLYRGDYPFSMRALIRERLPYFTPEERKKLIGSYDMLGLNYYTSRFAKHIDFSPSRMHKINTDDVYAQAEKQANGRYIGKSTGTDWLYSYPEGLKNLLTIIRERYGNPPVYITENGVGDMDRNGDLPVEKALNDDVRLNYLKDHIAIIKESIDMGCKVRGHFTWALLDNFEWQNGFTQRFGLIYVDRNNDLKRHMKKSAKWFAEFNLAGAKIDQQELASSNGVPKSTPMPASKAA
ncbi:hypothetical protein PR202_gb00212 [Eleusine coracana subsp. coracana]|uniref:4-hydroxy-7-methoxy-3-oxo-3,4-dihydro-2H-1,4-benzoxazin-2-yl glucosidebeta-D-glucosidase n=1 Tax=Eleusine coracana subsp. coracana TaxID=191504 RepID=A0AAV5DTH1_ELECO|nr:hypothetical protein QOZ80_5BG0432950 [Eleusine coracana subsp. coracana]GJN13500.1 hypothetical protein PR202_gb00212 [Eleusine coracana subsp. coracana]